MAALTDAEIQTVLDAWPADDAGLPGSVQTALDSWSGQTMVPISATITQLNDDPPEVFTTPRGRGYLKAHKVRTLVAHGVAVAAGGPTPLPAELRSMVSTPDVISEKIRVMEEQLRMQRQEIAALHWESMMAASEEQRYSTK